MAETTNTNENGNCANRVLSTWIPSAIWVKEWSERFDLLHDGNKIGYVNNSGWYMYSESEEELLKEYIKLHNDGAVNPCR